VPFLRVEGSSNTTVSDRDDQVRLPDPGSNLFSVELAELENEMLANGRAVLGKPIEVYGGVSTIRTLAKDRYEQREVLRPQQLICFINDNRNSNSPGDRTTQVIQAVHQCVPILSEISRELQGSGK